MHQTSPTDFNTPTFYQRQTHFIMSYETKTVFLTGANGFVASQILSDLIKVSILCSSYCRQRPRVKLILTILNTQLKYRVTASVRSESKAQEVLKLHPDWEGKVTFVLVQDIAKPGAFDAVFTQKAGFDYIIHTASPVDFSATDLQKDLIDPAVQGQVKLLTIKRWPDV